MKAVAIFFGIFLALMALLIFAKTRPAQALPMFKNILAHCPTSDFVAEREGETLLVPDQP